MDGAPRHPQTPAAAIASQDGRRAALELYYQMLRIRRFEERLLQLVAKGAIGGTTHCCIGQEAVPVGVSSRMHKNDLVVSTHRGHGHLLAKGGRADRLMAEIAGKSTGYCKGKGGSQHCAVPAIGHMGSNGITGGGMPIADGLALALRRASLQKNAPGGRCVICYIGDGAAATGNFHESLNLAAIWKLPVLFVMENNGYAMSTPMRRFAACDAFTDWASHYTNMAAESVDGNDVFAVAGAAEPLLEHARTGGGPAFLECNTYRQCGHSKSDPRNYRTREEEERWRAHDPLAVLEKQYELTIQEVEKIQLAVGAEIDEAARFALESHAGGAATALEDLFSPTNINIHVPQTAKPAPGPRRIRTFTEALRETLASELERDPDVVLLGEDIGVYGGAFGVTRGLLERFGGERVRDTPISENTIVGAAVGAAMGGLRPVVELMFGDFVTCCMDALVNHAAKIRYMYAGQARVPLVVRIPSGRRNGYGATHSQSLESLFLNIPGINIFYPSNAADAAGCLRAAIRSDDPVLVFEHKLLYPMEGGVPEGDLIVPPGSARIAREGADLTILSYGHAAVLSLEAAELLNTRGVSVEVVDLRSLAPLDRTTLAQSIQKTRRLLFVQEPPVVGGVCDRVIAELQPEIHRSLRAPAARLGSEHSPVPSSPELENYNMPSTLKIVRAALQLMSAPAR
ncbi:MAG: dehydrogenase [Planctomycetes bacterium]|nr:dehydrogenase [Planctomycetota bacterium]